MKWALLNFPLIHNTIDTIQKIFHFPLLEVSNVYLLMLTSETKAIEGPSRDSEQGYVKAYTGYDVNS